MFQFKPISPRIQTLRDKRANAKTYMDAERTKIYTDYYKTHENEPNDLKRAHCMYEWVSKKTILVEDEDIFVGNLGRTFRALNSFVEWDASWLYNATNSDDESFHAAWQTDGCFALMTDEDREIFRDAAEYWMQRSLTARFTAYLPPKIFSLKGNGCSDFFARRPSVGGVPQGHYCPNFYKVVNTGFGAIKEEALKRMAEIEGHLYDDSAAKFNYYQTTVIICDAAILLSKRYAKECLRQAENHKDPKRKQELLKMADSLNWIMEHPARNTWEALQAVLLYQMMVFTDGQQHGLSQGRIDQYAGWFAEEELANGTLTMEELQELSDAFFLKLNDNLLCARMGSNDMLTKMYNGKNFSYNTGGQHFTIGGVKRDGTDASNALTRCLLETTGRMYLADPSVDIRIHKNTPKDVWTLAIESSKVAGGIPSIENDEIIIPMLVKRGRSLEDARDYCIIGCVEPSGCGNEWCASGNSGSEAFFNLVGCIVMAIHNGTNPLTGFDGGVKTGYLYDYKTFEEFQEAYLAQMRYFLDWQISGNSCFELMQKTYFPSVVASAAMEGCMESGKDCTAGGAKYNSTGMTGCGIGNVADCLMAIKKFCFDDKICTLREMYDALCNNWEGYEDLYQKINHQMPHYGNNIDEVDELGAWAMNEFNDYLEAAHGPRGNTYCAGTFTMVVHMDYGAKTAATPDGRKSCEPIAEAISPRQGFDKNGPVAYLESAAKLPQYKLGNGDQLNIRFSSTSVAGDKGTEKLADLISTYFDLGGMEVQFNVVSTETLYDAQKNPDDYRNLIVRIAGFSAYFVEMPKGLQDDFITRTEQSL
jgi:pyruvate formate-lyase/glycerol dehydratase family glycyl radical enzyme